MSKKTGTYLLIVGVSLEVADRFLTPPRTPLSSNAFMASIQEGTVSVNQTFGSQFHVSYVLIAVGLFMIWSR